MADQDMEPPVIHPEELPIKLDGKNYHLWLEQVQAVVAAHNLERFFLNPSIPDKYASESDRYNDIVTKEYKQWILQDETLLKWLKSSLSENVLPIARLCIHSWHLWVTVEQHMTSHLRHMIGHNRVRLRFTKKKETQSISEYVASIKEIVDSLVEMGEPVPEQEHIQAILEGLPEEYDAIVNIIRTRDNPSIILVESFLLLNEARIQKAKIPDDDEARNG